MGLIDAQKTIYYRLHPEYYTEYVNKTGHDKAMQDFHTGKIKSIHRSSKWGH